MFSLFNDVKRNLARIYRHFSDYRWYFLLVSIISMIYSLLAGFGLAGFIPIFQLTENKNPENLSRVGKAFQAFFEWTSVELSRTNIFLLILLFLVLRWILYAGSQYLIQSIVADYKKTTVNRLSEKLFRSNWEYFQNQNKGSLLDYLTTRIVQVRHLFRIVTNLLVSYTVALGYLLVALWISVPLTVGAILLSTLIIGVMVPLAGKTKKISEKGVESQNQISRQLSEFMNAFREIKIYNVFNPVHNRIKQQTDRNADAEMKVGLMQKITQETFYVLISAAIIGGVYYALTFHNARFETIGMVSFLFILLFQRINKMDYVQRVAEYSPSINVLQEFSKDLDQEAEVINEPSNVETKQERLFQDRIQFKNVSFRYKNNGKENGDRSQKRALAHVNLTIPRGSMVSFVGKSGAGKSTMIGLLLGLFEPDKGVIQVDETPLPEIGLSRWRAHTGYVPQDPFLLNDTIANNIQFFREIDRSAVKWAARMSYSLEFIEEAPNGFDTVIGEEGMKLSGGQRQRLVFARAIADRPELLILDEATSELDQISEQNIRESLNELRTEMTILSVSHRLGTVIDSDQIFVLEGGNLVESGTKEELERKQGHFTELHQ